MSFPISPMRTATASVVVALCVALTGCALIPGAPGGGSTPLPTVTSAPSTKAKTSPAVTDAQMVQWLDSAPVPTLCTAPAGTLEAGRLPAFTGQAGQEVGLPWVTDARGRLKQDLIALGTFGPGSATLIATPLWCTGGTSSTEQLAIYQSAGTSLKLVTTFDLGAAKQANAHVIKITADDGRLEVLWGTPAIDQDSSDTGLWSRASFVVVGSIITESGLQSSASVPQ
ncbi:hypothetical protein EDF46_0513 [Frondihabitans sp. PhB188]|nr:hypothetical protein EDF46_0513 [Frondihabitans sp. PhB188]